MFHKHAARRGIRLGYNDTMKTFNKLDGDKFTFKHGNLTKNYKRYKTKLEKELNRLMDNKKSSAIGKVLKATYKKEISIDNLTKIIDFLGKSFELNDSLIYDIDKFNKILSDKISKMEPVDKND